MKTQLPLTAKLILAALLERPLTYTAIVQRLKMHFNDVNGFLYTKKRKDGCQHDPILFKLNLIIKYGMPKHHLFGINPDKLDVVKELIHDIEIPNREEANT